MRNSKKSHSSKIPPHMVAWLSAEGWTAEELSFVETSWKEGIVTEFTKEVHERVKSRMKIVARLEAQKGERVREYDSKNNYQGKDTPKWFGEGIDRDLFK